MTRRVHCSDAGSRDTTEADRPARPENPGLPTPALPDRPGLLPPRPPWSPPRVSANDPACAQSFFGKEVIREARKQTKGGGIDGERGRAQNRGVGVQNDERDSFKDFDVIERA